MSHSRVLYHYSIRSNSPFYTIITDKLLLFNSRFLRPGWGPSVARMVCPPVIIRIFRSHSLFWWLAKNLTRVLPVNHQTNAVLERARKELFAIMVGFPNLYTPSPKAKLNITFSVFIETHHLLCFCRCFFCPASLLLQSYGENRKIKIWFWIHLRVHLLMMRVCAAIRMFIHEAPVGRGGWIGC